MLNQRDYFEIKSIWWEAKYIQFKNSWNDYYKANISYSEKNRLLMRLVGEIGNTYFTRCSDDVI
jgi:hypothetical protein